MEDDANSDSEAEGEEEAVTFDLELTASKAYALHGLLRYCSISATDHETSLVAQTLAKEVHDTMPSEEFVGAMEDEMDEYEEMIQQPQQENPFSNFQGGAFQ